MERRFTWALARSEFASLVPLLRNSVVQFLKLHLLLFADFIFQSGTTHSMFMFVTEE